MRKLFARLFGDAAVVGFEATFGFSRWKPWEPEEPVPLMRIPLRPMTLIPGGVIYVDRYAIQMGVWIP